MKTFNRGSTQAHQNLVKLFFKEASIKFPNIFIANYTVGMFRDFDSATRIIHAGTKGVPDLLLYGKNWYLFLDAKTGRATFSKEQLAFKKRIFEITGKDLVHKLTSVDQGLELIGQYEK